MQQAAAAQDTVQKVSVRVVSGMRKEEKMRKRGSRLFNFTFAPWLRPGPPHYKAARVG
jgi:hypothetical protein